MSDGRYANSHLCLTGGNRWLEGGVLFTIVLVCAFALSGNSADADLWGHVQYGRDALAAGGLPATTTYSFTAQGYRWINHENLAELLMALGADTIGPIGLMGMKVGLGVLLIGLLMRHAQRQHVSLITLCIVTLVATVVLMPCWTIRPQLLTYLFFTLMLLILSWSFHGWEGRWRLSPIGWRADIEECNELTYFSRRLKALWLVPLMMVLWTNSHGGFVAGVCFFTAYLGLRSMEALACKGRAAWGLISRFAMMVAATGLATLINPYSYDLHRWLLKSLSAPRPEIMEWHPPALFQPYAIPFWVILITWAVALIFTRRSRDFTHMVLLAVAAWQMLEHQRHAAFFAIAFAMWMPVHIESTLRQLRLANDSTAFGVGVPGPFRWTFALLLCVTLVMITGRLSRRLGDLPVFREEYPVSAMEYIAEQDLHGKLVVTFDWAQYAIAAFGTNDPNQKGMQVGFDGRYDTCYPFEIVDMHFDLILGDLGPRGRYRSPNSPPLNGSRVLEHGQPDLVLIARKQTHSEAILRRHADEWVLLYQDQLAQLWGRASKYDDPTNPAFIPPQRREITEQPQIGSVTWPAIPQQRKNA